MLRVGETLERLKEINSSVILLLIKPVLMQG